MRGYILSVAAAAALGTFCDVLLPREWKKYAGILTGAILLITLITPWAKLKNPKLLTFDLPQGEYEQYDVMSEIERELAKRVEEDICLRMKEEFNIDCAARAEIKVQDGKISGVQKITLSCGKNSAAAARLYEVYGCGEVVFENG